MRPAGWVVVATAILVATGCGAAPPVGGSDASGSRTTSPTQPIPSPSTPQGWETYADSQYGFSVAYPPGFSVQQQGPGAGAIQLYRAFDPQHTTNGYPSGQIEFAIYPNDAATLTDWIAKHTGTPSPTANPFIYWEQTSNVESTAAAGRNAVYFDVANGPSGSIIHNIAFFWNASYIFQLDWWSSDGTYAATLDSSARQMMNSFRGSP